MDEPQVTREVRTSDSSSAPSPASPQLAASSEVRPPSNIFYGSEGLRWGWRLALYIALSAVSLVVVALLGRVLHQRFHFVGLPLQMFAELGALVAAVFPAALLAGIERRPFGAYGLPSRRAFGKSFWIGTLWGIVAISLLIVVMRSVGVFYFGTVLLHGSRLLKFAAFWAFFFLVVGFFEEFLTRGYTQFTLARGMGFWPAAVLMSTLFGALHLGNANEGWVGALAAGFIGLFFCLTLRRTGDLWFAVGFHASWDWCESYLYSVPDSGTNIPGHLLSSSFHGSKWLSGGVVGPEGSLLVFPLIAVLWFAFDRWYREVRWTGEPTGSPIATSQPA